MSTAMFDIELPVFTSPIGTIEEIRIAATGTNLGCVYENDLLGLKYNRKFNSSLNTCQKNHGELDFGTITNSGRIYDKYTRFNINSHDKTKRNEIISTVSHMTHVLKYERN
mgnify:CR=1 FL=1